jgi:hypothetical protein
VKIAPGRRVSESDFTVRSVQVEGVRFSALTWKPDTANLTTGGPAGERREGDCQFESRARKLFTIRYTGAGDMPTRKAVSNRTLVQSAVFVGAIVIAASCAAPVAADVVRLKSGGEIRGEFVSGASKSEADSPIVIETLLGNRVTIAREDVDSIQKRRRVVEEYVWKSRSAALDVDEQWALAEWCRTNGLSAERKTHLQIIIALDGNHEPARRGLGHLKKKGEWVSPDELMESRGYVKHRGKWVLPQELELIEDHEKETAAEKEWIKRIRLWATWLASGNSERQMDAVRQIQMIRDDAAVLGLSRSFSGHRDKVIRNLYIATLAQIGGKRVVAPLVQQSIWDADSELRANAVDAIPGDQRLEASRIYTRMLRHENNLAVNRSATALANLGDLEAIGPLIEALITQHRHRVKVPVNNGVSATQTGFAQPLPFGGLPPDIAAGLVTGQYVGVTILPDPSAQNVVQFRTMTVVRPAENKGVRDALKRLTRSDFGYDKNTWWNWYKLNREILTNQAAKS